MDKIRDLNLMQFLEAQLLSNQIYVTDTLTGRWLWIDLDILTDLPPRIL